MKDCLSDTLKIYLLLKISIRSTKDKGENREMF